ncbi:MAG: hypothetical protein WCI72_04130 [archaeon]
MFFRTKKEPIDIRDIPRPKVNFGKAFVAKDGMGFVDLTKTRKLPSEIAKEKALVKTIGHASPSTSSSSSSSFSFFDTPQTPTPMQTSSINNSDTEDLMRKISSQISDLDTKLYKMEQRIELLERKAGIDNNSSSPSGFTW